MGEALGLHVFSVRILFEDYFSAWINGSLDAFKDGGACSRVTNSIMHLPFVFTIFQHVAIQEVS
jgi:hypothetical protein